MKKTLLTLLTSLLLACGGATSTQPQPAPQPTLPPVVEETPMPIHITQIARNGCYLNLNGVSSWHLSNTPSDGTDEFILDNNADADTHIVFMQLTTNQPLLVLAPQIHDKMASKEVQVSDLMTIVVNGVSAQQMSMAIKNITVWTTIFATGKHADIIGCGGLTIKQDLNKALCDRVLQGFYITE
jgi:hypothetical protein